MAHLPALLLSELLHALDRLVIGFREPLLLLGSGTGSGAKFLEGPSEMAAEERCPLQISHVNMAFPYEQRKCTKKSQLGKRRKERKETYRNQPHPRIITEPIHLPLLLPIQQAIMILHADELRPPSLLRHELQARKLRRPHAARPDIPHLAAAHQVVQRLHRLLGGRMRVEAVDLQEVDIRRVETG